MPGGEDVITGRRLLMAYLALTHYLPQLLVQLDQLSAAAGLTLHTPFADWRRGQ
ncbi:asparagine synthase C-terminal domain-containing protein [Actinoplanes aureus]|uniref:asparagine synthase C-terminal domain-containing protein n=1 Tax=Actinoplanes aureus TaxID=2792083 RepID=UPI001E4743A7|nr:asparagine synthase C-terminal domain-containing protein [Actinoplanes aureus]